MTPRRGERLAWVGGLAGAALMAFVGRQLSLDVYGDRCDLYPAPQETAHLWAIWYAGLALLTFAWAAGVRHLSTVRGALLLGLGVHAVAALALPYLSTDPLMYAAIGRAQAEYGASPYVPLHRVLPPRDPLLMLLPEAWRRGTSAYFGGFNALAALIGHVAGERTWLHLRLYQLVGLACSAGAALLVARARPATERPGTVALVLLCPLTVVDATQNAHNDALLMLAVSAYALAVVRRPGPLGLAALAAALAVKASALLALGVETMRLVVRRLRRQVTPARALAGGALAIVLGVLGYVALARRFPVLWSFTQNLGSPADPYERCTRSFECLPRGILRYVADAPGAAWVVGLVFRAASALWLLYAATRAARDERPLAWMGAGLFIYYLFFHGFMQSWYLLSIVPLLPFFSPRLRPAAQVHLVCATAYYPIDMAFSCIAVDGKPFKELAMGVVATLIPTLYLVVRLTRTRADDK